MTAPQVPQGWQTATTALEANQVASQAVQHAINNLNIPTQQRNWIATQWAQLPPNQNLHQNCQPKGSGWGAQGPVVQVDTVFAKLGAGNTYRVEVMLDVDDPPPEESTQPPHFGWEVHLDRKRAANGHVALPPGILSFGRTFKGKGLESYGYGLAEDDMLQGMPDGMRVEASFKRYK